ncbi:MAG: beta-propeller fold lactonase family protein [Candidatus Binatia bacterium]
MIASCSRRIAAYVGIVGAILASLVATSPANAASPFTLFETGQVRPLAMSPDGNHLYAVNTPDNRLEIFDITIGGITHVASVPVGLEPLAVAARTNTEVWVVNHLSDSISVVDVTTAATARVVRTLLVGDEPRDLVFAGPGSNRAFITTAHRGQNTPFHATIETILRTPSLGRADVWVFDATNLGAALGGTPLTTVTMFGDTPRALTVSPDGSTVYAAVFQSGNRTTTLSEALIPDSGPNALPAPKTSFNGTAGPEVGLIVRYDGSKWTDELNRDWSSLVRFSLPDKDVFAIDANANPPIQVAGPSGFYSGVGTILFNMVANPVSGKVYVANLESVNHVRFEGEGIYSSGFKPVGEPASVRGHLAESRITVLDGGSVVPRHLNKHIDYTTCCDPIPNTENDNSIAFPTGMAVSSDGATLYVAGFGSSEVGVYNTAQLENDTFTPAAANQIPVSGGGPTGLVLDEARTRLYVLTRFDNSISVLSTGTGQETSHVGLHNPEPANVVAGRPILYDTTFSSSHGDSSCASCHIFGDFDSLAWDLGDPDGTVLNNPGPFSVGPFINPDFHPMKGPMTTQSLRGMANHGPMHWRGDRTGGNDAGNIQPNSGAFDEDAGFKKFNPAFVGLLGRSAELTPTEMQAFTDFILQVMYPPNPIRNLDNSLTPSQSAGRTFFNGPLSDTFQDCNGCHVLQPTANAAAGVPQPGFFGTNGGSSFENETQVLKVPHLRNMYQKVGMFGMAAVPFFNAGNNANQGDQIRGFGFLHDGSVDTLFRFHNATVFNQSPQINNTGIPAGAPGDPTRRNLDAFMMAFDSNLAPIVGQQITRTSSNAGTVDPRITLLAQRADAGECDLIAKGEIAGAPRGYLYVGGGTFETDRASEAPVSDATVRALANSAGQEITFTCVPPGEGLRIGIDRDDDGFGDGDELDNGSDPSDAGSVPAGISPVCQTLTATIFKSATLSDKTGRTSLRAEVLLGSYAQERVSATANDSDGIIFTGGVAGNLILPKGTGFKYKAPRGTLGVTDVTVKEKRNSGGIFRITLKTKGAWAIGAADEDEFTTALTLNVGGTCFRGNAKHVR